MAFRLNPTTGTLDLINLRSESAITATKLQITRLANGAILAGEAVKADNATHVSNASADSTASNATVLGIAANDALATEPVNVVLFGAISDPVYSIFTVNSPLFLDIDGGLTDVKRTTGYHTEVGKSLGGTEIFISIQPPVAL